MRPPPQQQRLPVFCRISLERVKQLQGGDMAGTMKGTSQSQQMATDLIC